MLETGQVIEGKYRIARMIGEGGMGAVYEGENVRISRRVAIKVLHGGLTQNQEVTQRFEREAQAAGRIGNDHILEVLDLGSFPNGDHYIVMEYLDGEPLSARIKQHGRLQPFDLAPIIRQMLVGLGAAHRAGIVHRDLKPDNIYLLKEKAGKQDFVKIIDFGISKFQPLNSDGMRMTRTGAMMGTPYYMSPEQASGSHEVDQRSDLYAVGVIMFEAATGQVPFDAATFNQLMFKIVLEDQPRPEAVAPDMDPAFASLISKAMARDMAQRFQDAQQFADAIDGWMRQGSAVTVPPSADAAAQSLLSSKRTRAGLPSGSTTGPGTGGSWATSQVDAAPPKKSRLGLMLGLGGGLVAAVAVAAVALRPTKQPEPAADAASAAPVVANAGAVVPVAPPEPVAVPPPPAPAAPEPSASVAAPASAPTAAVAAIAPRPQAPKAGPAPAAPSPKPAAAASAKKRRDFGY
jgi:serine/threonine protein kinase